MVQRQGGMRRKTRHKLQKNVRQKGKISFQRFFQKLAIGDKVKLNAEPAHHKGMYYPRFHGKVGDVIGMQGECYTVQIKDGSKLKEVIVHPVHLKKI
jgi:large subunit ribosomal protein L21e